MAYGVVIFLVEGYLPSFQSLGSESDIQEERRLFYVAATRAKENLFLIMPKMNRSRNFYDPNASMLTRVSRFLEEGNILPDYVRIKEYKGDPYTDYSCRRFLKRGRDDT